MQFYDCNILSAYLKKWQGLNDPAILFKDSVEILFYKPCDKRAISSNSPTL